MKQLALLFIFLTSWSYKLLAGNDSTPTNIVLIFCDDLGFGDLACYGSLWNQTPEIDKMAVEGLKFTDFYAGAPVCTPSRAGLMTGSYARRVDLDLDHNNAWVLFPRAKKGINPQEIILPEMLRKAGYSTAIIGKWHLGDQLEFLPARHGFDYWFGLPYSNDMGIRTANGPKLPLLHNDTVIEHIGGDAPGEQALLTERYTEKAIEWIGENKGQPFFLYLAHTMPHHPVAAREQFYQLTNNPKEGYGASVAELSWSTGKLLNFLKEEGLAENTLVIFTSDNGGPGVSNNGILKGNKGLTSEGGVRVPCIAWWPGKILPGTTCHAPASVLDFYPTFASLANLQLNDHVKRDGTDILDYFLNPGKEREARTYFYWHVGYLMGVRYGEWKLNLTGNFSEEEKQNILKSTYNKTHFADQLELYNLNTDPKEEKNVAAEYPDIVNKILKMAETEKTALGQFTGKGPEVRETITIESPDLLIR